MRTHDPIFSLVAVSLMLALLAPVALAQELPLVLGVAPQPLLAQAQRLGEALSFMGSRLHAEDLEQLLLLRDQAPSAETAAIQRLLDPYCLAMVEINPEARVKVLRGPAAAELVQGGWKSFLVKVENGAELKGRLEVSSPNALSALHISTYQPRVVESNIISAGESANRFLELALYRQRPLLGELSGLGLEYVILQAYTREVGKREARLAFRVGPGTEDLGFRNAVDILFEIRPSVEVVLRVRDDDGSPTMASFVITDGIDRFFEEPGEDMREVLSESFRNSIGTILHLARPLPDNYRRNLALHRPWDWALGSDPTREQVQTPGWRLPDARTSRCREGRVSGLLLSTPDLSFRR